MCNCISELKANVTEHYAKLGKTVQSVKIADSSYSLINSGINRSTQTAIKILFEKGKDENMTVNHTFCPFCGERYLAKAEVQHG